MSIKNKTGVGPDYVPAYQVSGVPFVTSSQHAITTTPVSIDFPRVTRFISVTNTGVNVLRLGFSENGVNGLGQVSGSNQTVEHEPRANYFILPVSGATGRLELRCKSLFIRADTGAAGSFSVMAGLTGIDKNQFPVLTGSNFFKGIG